MTARIGFMQGRLSPLYDGRVQAFPWNHWQDEFRLAEQLGFTFLEWTLERDRLDDNPVMSDAGRRDIRRLMATHRVAVPSLTGDCFMQAPFHKATGAVRDALLADAERVIAACGALGIADLVIPLVDAASVGSDTEESAVLDGLRQLAPLLDEQSVRLLIESDFAPDRLARFIDALPEDRFGINYDSGNSAALGFDPRGEIAAWGKRIGNVHVKDRRRDGASVQLGAGAANFETVFRALEHTGYAGRFVLQTARAADGDHAGALCRSRDRVVAWLAAAAGDEAT